MVNGSALLLAFSTLLLSIALQGGRGLLARNTINWDDFSYEEVTAYSGDRLAVRYSALGSSLPWTWFNHPQTL